jgi:hypothetical protein
VLGDCTSRPRRGTGGDHANARVPREQPKDLEPRITRRAEDDDFLHDKWFYRTSRWQSNHFRPDVFRR